MKKVVKIIALVLILAISSSFLLSCSEECVYANERDIKDRDIHYVEIKVKDFGKIVVLLDATTAPITVANFLKPVNEGFYDGLKLHRVIKDFMIQGGDPNGNGSGGSKDTIKGEFSSNGVYNDLKHKRGVISMARSSDKDSASSQFFICNADAEHLDGEYAAFGYVVKGMSVVDKITKKVFPKTYLAEFYGDDEVDPYYGVSYHYIWQYYGNGTIEEDKDKPVIEYIRVLENYNG